MTGLIQRRLDDIVRRRMAESPVVLLQGPRSVGKSTLLAALARRHDRQVIDLDDLAVRCSRGQRPRTVRLRAQAVFIDEYQHVPTCLPQSRPN